jgi:hypothetical protein
MRRGIFFLVTMAAALALVACEDDTGKTAAQGAITDADLAVSADFEEEAERSITASNYKAELDALDKEIAAE